MPKRTTEQSFYLKPSGPHPVEKYLGCVVYNREPIATHTLAPRASIHLVERIGKSDHSKELIARHQGHGVTMERYTMAFFVSGCPETIKTQVTSWPVAVFASIFAACRRLDLSVRFLSFPLAFPQDEALQNSSDLHQPESSDFAESEDLAPTPEIKTRPAMYQGGKEELLVQLPSYSASLGITGINADAWEKIAEYCIQVWSWNQSINLTRHTTPELFVKRDLLDSWHLANLIDANEEILDIGSGGGVPGVLVAILRSDVQVTLCDSVAKKAKVLQRIVDHLELKIPVYPLSVQKVLEDFRYDTLTARAVGPLGRLCHWLQEDWHKFRRLLAIKGPKWVEERGEARHKGLLKNIELRRVAAYNMPDTESESTILQLLRPRG
jgi:16S rRNA (guanine527-N7)-methyltransferase